MFSPNKTPRPDRPSGKKIHTFTSENKQQLIAILLLTVVLLVIYYGSIALAEANPGRMPYLVQSVLGVYMIAFAVLLVSYLLYNRAFVNKNVTVDMLPDDWDDEKKQAFVDATAARAQKSRWMLTLIIPFVVVFMAEALYLFVWNGWLGQLVGQL